MLEYVTILGLGFHTDLRTDRHIDVHTRHAGDVAHRSHIFVFTLDDNVRGMVGLVKHVHQHFVAHAVEFSLGRECLGCGIVICFPSSVKAQTKMCNSGRNVVREQHGYRIVADTTIETSFVAAHSNEFAFIIEISVLIEVDIGREVAIAHVAGIAHIHLETAALCHLNHGRCRVEEGCRCRARAVDFG